LEYNPSFRSAENDARRIILEVYLKKAVVKGLFDSKLSLEMPLDDGVNCIHGINGSGKTVFINLLVGVLNCQMDYLRRISFESISIYILKKGNIRPTRMFTVSREQDSVVYQFHIALEPKGVKSIASMASLFSGTPDFDVGVKKGDEIRVSLDTRSYEPTSYRLKRLIDSLLSETYVPLLRGHESSTRRKHREPDSEHDPYVQMLASLQEDFSRRYGAANSKVNNELEALKSQMFERLLFDDSDSTIRQDMDEITNITRTRKINIYTDAEKQELIKDISNSNIRVGSRKVERHFSIWEETQQEVIDTLTALNSAKNTGKAKDEDIARLHDDYSKAYFKCLASIKFNRKFNLAIQDIKKAQVKKDRVLSPFRVFESQMNEFLSKTKQFKLGPSGSFEIYIDGRMLPFPELSSGEKHILAILARVCLSAFDKNTLFIADEPELSLHLEWQRKIIPAINQISPEMQVIVATHSPAVIPDGANMIDILECYSDAK